MHPLPEIEWLETFAVFAEHKNFTRAAQALHLSQPAVHGHVRKLTELLGMPLYRKQGRELLLTEAGEAVRTFARDQIARSARFIADLRGLAHGPVVLAAGEGSLLYLLGPALAAFTARPGNRLRLLVRDAAATLDAIRTHAAHLGVAPTNDHPADLDLHPIATIGHHLIMLADDPLADRTHLTLPDLAYTRLIVPPPDRPHRQTLAAAFDHARVPWSIAVEVPGWPLALHCVALGLGRAIVNDFCPPPPGCIARPIHGLPTRTWHAIRRRDATPTPPEDHLWNALLAR